MKIKRKAAQRTPCEPLAVDVTVYEVYADLLDWERELLGGGDTSYRTIAAGTCLRHAHRVRECEK